MKHFRLSRSTDQLDTCKLLRTLFLVSVLPLALHLLPTWASADSTQQTPIAEPKMILIPAGTATIGNSEKDAEWVVSATGVEGWRPSVTVRQVPLKAFYIADLEVTNEEYQRFVNDTGHRIPAIPEVSTAYDWVNGQPKADLAEHPVVLVSQTDAKQYCIWLSKRTGKKYRLPTQDEWEKAASWSQAAGRKLRYPWGDDYKEGFSHVVDNARDTLGTVSTRPVGTNEIDVSPYGLHDMAGNVSEWVKEDGTLRGGSFANFSSKVAIMNALATTSWQYSSGVDGIHVWRGFRVARDP